MNLTTKTQKQPGKVVHTDHMIQQIEMKGNKVLNTLPLLDGEYTIIVLSNKDRTRREWEMYWFSIIEEFVLQTGNDKYTTHELFKKEYGIASTKELQSDTAWQAAINELKKWTLMNS